MNGTLTVVASTRDWDEGVSDRYQSHQRSSVGFGGGAPTKITGKSTLNVPGLPKINNVLLGDGLLANLLSISQLCDSDLKVKFSHNAYIVFDDEGSCVMIRNRSSNNCYLLKPNAATTMVTCFLTKVEELMLWNKKT